jgi:hypothetical protein
VNSPTNPARRLAVALALILAVATTGACGDAEGADVDESLRSTGADPFELVASEEEGRQTVTGHGIVLEVPADWRGYDEKESFDGTTYEWAVSQPEDVEPAPAYVQFSMGKPGKGAGYEQIDEATKSLAEVDPSYELRDEGEASVPGAERAKYLRFAIDIELGGRAVPMEQLQLFVELPGGEVSTLRFLAPDGTWEEQLEDVYDSLVVAQSEEA